MATVYLGLGSNLGDRQENINRALEYLSQRLRFDKKSSVYDTEPMDNPSQPRFLNMVCRVTTTLEPKMLLAVIKGIESKMGRLPAPTSSPRVIDIDILLYDDRVVDTPELKIPHPRLAERAFVLVPMAELAPDLQHPVLKQTMKDLLRMVKGTQGVLKFKF